jgi:formylglycine-generating enzyme required for sulfatase activity
MKIRSSLILLLIIYCFDVSPLAAADQGPLNDGQVVTLLQSGYSSADVQKLIDDRGYNGGTDTETMKKLKDAGAAPELVLDIVSKNSSSNNRSPSEPASTPPTSTPAASAPANGPVDGQPWTNSLGMKFVPAGTSGILFCIWDVRVQDFRAFTQDSGFQSQGGLRITKFAANPDGSLYISAQNDPNGSWQNTGFEQGPTHPVVGVSWNDAKAFCDWLTKKERADGKLGRNQIYRLPTDEEWSRAVGLTQSEATPKERFKDGILNDEISHLYLWGKQWPPPAGSGNFCGEEFGNENFIKGYRDGYPFTSPVGTFAASSYGLFDMEGNVRQWCEDFWDPQSPLERITRGSAYNDYNTIAFALFAGGRSSPDTRMVTLGFRVVKVVSP